MVFRHSPYQWPQLHSDLILLWLLSFKNKTYFLFLFMCICVPACIYVPHMHAGSCRGHGCWIPGTGATDNCEPCDTVLVNEPGSSMRTVSALNCRATSLGLYVCFIRRNPPCWGIWGLLILVIFSDLQRSALVDVNSLRMPNYLLFALKVIGKEARPEDTGRKWGLQPQWNRGGRGR